MIRAPKNKVLLEDYLTKDIETPSGIIVPPTSAFMDNGRIMMVRSVGKGVNPELKAGQRVLTKTYQGILVEHEGEMLRSCVEDDILLILD